MTEQPQYVAIDNQERFLAIVFAEKPDALRRLKEIVALPRYKPATKARQDKRDARAAEWAQTLHLGAPWVVPKAINMLVRTGVLVLDEPFPFQHPVWMPGVPFTTWERAVDKAYQEAKRTYARRVKWRQRQKRSLHWLFEYQVLGREYAEIAATADVSKQYTRTIVTRTAAEIALTLRTATAGRPRKTTTKTSLHLVVENTRG